MKPWALLVMCGVAVACFVAGRFTARDNSNGIHIEHDATAGRASGGDDASTASQSRSTNSSQKTTPIKNATEFRGEIDKLRNLSSMTYHSEFGVIGGSGSKDTQRMKEMIRLNERLATSDVAALIEEYAQSPYTQRDAQGLRILVSIMADRDPEAAWKLAERLPKPMRNAAFQTTITFLAEKNPDAALAKLDDFKGTSRHGFMRRSIIHEISKEDPQRVFALANTSDGQARPEDQGLMGMVFSNWVRKDMKAAQAALEKLDGQARNSAVDAVAAMLAETDPAAAWKFTSENLSSNVSRYTYYDGARFQILSQWMLLDPKAALAAVAAEQDDNKRSNLLSNSLRSWAFTDYDAASQHILASTDANVLASGLITLANMPESNRMELFNTMLERLPAEQLNRNMNSFLYEWARVNPREAAAAIEQLPLGDAYSSAVQQISSLWYDSATNKNEPLQWALSMNPGDVRSYALSNMFSSWSETDPAAAAAAAMRLSDEDRRSLAHTITSAWSKKDPQAAINWAASLPDADERKNTIFSTLGSIAGSNPQQAVAMLNSLGMSNDVDAVRSIVHRWVGSDFNGASEWVKKLPDGDVRNQALSSVAYRLAGEEPQAAIAWAQAINDQNSRTSTIQDIVYTWKRHDAEAAKAWVATSNLPEDVKKRLSQ